MNIFSCFYEPSYRNVRNEEGSYEVHNGFVVVAQAYQDGLIGEYLYQGRGIFPLAFTTEEKAKHFVEQVKDKGRINTLYWDLVNLRDPNELPDYVTNPQRPEYN